TRSLGAQSPAQSEQWCCCFGRRRIISGSAENRGSSRPSAIDRPPAQASPLRSYIRPELRFPHAAAQTRIVSVARIRLDSRKSVRPFKGIFCDDISEFESHMPSQAVPSLPANVGKHRSNGVVPRSDLQPKRRLCRTATGRPAKQGHVLFWRAFLPV